MTTNCSIMKIMVVGIRSFGIHVKSVKKQAQKLQELCKSYINRKRRAFKHCVFAYFDSDHSQAGLQQLSPRLSYHNHDETEFRMLWSTKLDVLHLTQVVLVVACTSQLSRSSVHRRSREHGPPQSQTGTEWHSWAPVLLLHQFGSFRHCCKEIKVFIYDVRFLSENCVKSRHIQERHITITATHP